MNTRALVGIVGDDPVAFSRAVLKDIDLARERGQADLTPHFRLIEIGLRSMLEVETAKAPCLCYSTRDSRCRAHDDEDANRA